MSEGRKRRGLPALASSGRRRRVNEDLTPASVMRGIMAAVIAVAAVSSGVAHTMHRPEIRKPIYEPRRLDWDKHVQDLEERGCFKRMYRMPKDTFQELAGLLAPLLCVSQHHAELRTINAAASKCVRLAVASRILAKASYLDVALMFDLAVSTVFYILWQVIDAINNTPEVGPFVPPQTEFDCRGHAARFKRLSTKDVFGGVVACVDGLLIKTTAPCPPEVENVPFYYSGSKSAYGVNVQAMCNADHRLGV